jgi:cysteine-rich repeat protein
MTFLKSTLFAFLLTVPLASCGGDSESWLDRAGETGGVDGGNGDGGDGDECVFTQGYWKNHPEAWPVSSLTLGTVSYTQAELLAILNTPVAGNGLIQLAHQLIAAKLNIANGGDSSDIGDEILEADALIDGLVVPPIGEGFLRTSVTSSLNDELTRFNEHGECENGEPPNGPVCGNGIKEYGEECDDGNTVDNDTCSNDCKICLPDGEPVCGNGIKEAGEECDDGNTVETDSCDNSCKICEPVPG